MIDYYETHHILPKCMGGNNLITNLVKLTPEEHYLAHQLLVKIYPTVSGLAFACIKMAGNPHGKRNNKIYGWLRRKHASDTSIRSIGNKGGTGRTQSTEERQRRAESLKEYYKLNPRSEEHKRKNVDSYKNSNKVINKKKETAKRKIEQSLIERPLPKKTRIVKNPMSAKSYEKVVATRRKNAEWQSKESYKKMWETRRANKQKLGAINGS